MLSTFYSGRSKKDVLPFVKHNVGLALSLAPKNRDSLFAAAGYAQMESRHEDVLTYCEQAISINPNFAPAHAKRAGVLPILGRMDEALEAYGQAIALDPLSPGLLGNYAWTLLITGNIAGALESLEKNLRWNPQSVDALNLAGVIYQQVADFPAAVEHLIQAYQLNPKSYSSQERLVSLYMNFGLTEKAEAIAGYTTQKAVIAALKGNHSGAAAMLDGDSTDFGVQEAGYLARRYEIPHRVLYKTATEALLKRKNELNEFHGLYFAELFFVFNEVNDPAAPGLYQLVDDYYRGKTPADFKYPNDHLGGVAYHLIREKPDEALAWLDAAIDRDHAFLFLTARPALAPLEHHPGYPQRLTAMQEIAARHRLSIEHIGPMKD